jgi:hypothetical protein
MENKGKGIYFIVGMLLFVLITPQAGWALDIPSMYEPTSAQSDVALKPTFKWLAVTGAKSYKVQIGVNSFFSSASDLYVQDFNETGTSWTTTKDFQYHFTYYWRVIAYVSETNDDSKEHSVSPIWSFTTIMGPPAKPTLSTPTNGGSASWGAIQYLNWNSSKDATKYYYKISTNKSTCLRKVEVVGNSTQADISYLPPNTTFYWSVIAENSKGSIESDQWNFTTGSNPGGSYLDAASTAYANRYTSEGDGGKDYNPIYFSYSTEHGGPTGPNLGYCTGWVSGCPGSTDCPCTGDCTNFVSQCIKGGGLTLSIPPQTTANKYMDSKGCLIGVQIMHDYLKDVYNKDYPWNYQECNNGDLPTKFEVSKGDVIQFGVWVGHDTKPWHHSIIVVSVSSQSLSGIIITNHDQDRENRPLSELYPGVFSKAYFHHMPRRPNPGMADPVAVIIPK